MINITNKKYCCGCYACNNICPKGCISMVEDNEGFYYPNVDINKCIDCKLCEEICPFYNDLPRKQFLSMAYACKSKNQNIRLQSSSGGIFNLLCKYTISNKGVVFGAAFDKNFEVVHNYAETLDECSKFYGSKYVQSRIMSSYKKAKEFLDDGKIVLFSGTQCQIKGLNMFLQKKYLNLITVEVICHGVPSSLVLKKYMDNLSKINKSKIKLIKFRDKNLGWHKFSFMIQFENKKIYSGTLDKDVFMRGFLSNLYLRPSCYECKAKNYKSNSDISLGDYWGIEKIYPKFDDDKGVSLVLLNSKKGLEIFKKILSYMDIMKSNLDYAIKYNPSVIESVSYNRNRERYFNIMDKMDIESAIIKYTKVSFINKIKNKLARTLKKTND